MAESLLKKAQNIFNPLEKVKETMKISSANFATKTVNLAQHVLAPIIAAFLSASLTLLVIFVIEVKYYYFNNY